MGQTTDELKANVDSSREAATQKIEAIQDQVMDTVHQAEQKVTDTAQQVKEKLDWRTQVEQRPLMAIGAAFIGGVVLSSILSDDDDDTRRYRSGIAPSYGSQSWAGNQAAYGSASTYGVGPSYPSIGDSGSAARNGGSGMGLMGSIRKAARTSGFEDTLNNMTSSFMSTMTDRLRQMADEAFPGMGEKLQNVIEGMTGESDGSGSSGSTGGSSTSGSGSQASAGMGSGQGSTLGTSGYGTAASGSGGSVPSTSDYAHTGELGSSLTNS
jgi:ElaB/YqjD/DUF883 family membrane-anchored ribosome-binding protein